MSTPLIQSAVNLSEGRRPEVIAAIVAAAEGASGAVVADWSADPDHNRMVVTLLGGPDAIRGAVLAMAAVAVERVDLRHHTGVHPRIGALDVVPLVPLRGVTMEECIALSRELGAALARRFALPVYLYERSAEAGRRSALPELRRGGFEGLFTEPLTGERGPDFGPPEPHPTAGATVVGARGPLIAYNIDLIELRAADASRINAARRVAAAIRRDRDTEPALAGVRALGLWLPSQARAQVSMNLTRPDATTLPAVFDWVRREAARHGAEAALSQVIGIIPRAALGGEPPVGFCWRNAKYTQLLEYWLQQC